MLLQFRNPEVYGLTGYMYHRKCSLLLQYDRLHEQHPVKHMSMPLHRNQPLRLLHHPLMLRFSARRYLLSGLSIFHKCYLHHEDQNDPLHAGCYGIHKKMSDKLELLLHLLPDPAVPVLHVTVMSQTLNFFLHMISYS